MAYSSITKPTLHLDTVTWDTVDTSIDTLSFAPDFAWIKIRDNASQQDLILLEVLKRTTLGQTESTQSVEIIRLTQTIYF